MRKPVAGRLKEKGGTGEANFSDCYQREHMNYRKCESYPEGNSLRLFFNYQIGGGGARVKKLKGLQSKN